MLSCSLYRVTWPIGTRVCNAAHFLTGAASTVRQGVTEPCNEPPPPLPPPPPLYHHRLGTVPPSPTSLHSHSLHHRRSSPSRW
ncbi:hypothetical protein EAG_14077 [Camponotus floridanus]|uniref:Uncharacterized protein n=1 Tax=Camponotus floridanus TaxID=104421 RepID=E1ZX75_CAMFO|nr:hypothetical protein EAG_14077 [Camponotus floridanus]